MATRIFLPRTCERCGEEYLPTSNSQRYCPDHSAKSIYYKGTAEYLSSNIEYTEDRVDEKESLKDSSYGLKKPRFSDEKKFAGTDDITPAQKKIIENYYKFKHPVKKEKIKKQRVRKAKEAPIYKFMTEEEWRQSDSYKRMVNKTMRWREENIKK